MKTKGLALSLLTLSLFSTSTAIGAGLCSKLFESTPKISTDPRDYLSKKKLSADGLELDTDYQGEIILRERGGKILGKLAVKSADYLYQWAPLDYQKSYIEAGGIDKAFLQEIISDPSQTYGKGFYVSTNPYDSSSYGDGMTVFKTVSPLITIEQYFNGVRIEEATTQTIQKLQRIDIDAIQSVEETWLSIINHKQLVTTNKISGLDGLWDQKYLPEQILLLSNFKSGRIHTWLPRDHIIRRMINKKLTKFDVSLIKKVSRFSSGFKPDTVLARGAVVTISEYKESLNLLNQALAAVGEAPLDL